MATAVAPAKKGEEEKKEPRKVDIDFHGEKFVIPEDMDMDEAIDALVRQRDEDRVEVTIGEPIQAFPLDGAVCFQKALKELYGWANLVPSRDFFGENPPHLIGVEIEFGKTIQVPWGNCRVPKIEGLVSTGYSQHNGMPIFNLGATVRRRHEKTVAKLAAKIREIAINDSIYRGQAVKVNFRDKDGDRPSEYHPRFAPQFIDMKKYDVSKIVYAEETERLIQTNLFNPVMFTERCRKHGVPLKRGILLEGKYGTGKTLTAHHLAQICVKNGWTFLYVEDVRDLDMAIHFAKMYAPCVLFAEDVDRTMPQGGRTPEIDRILNVLDGVESKNVDVITVLTTNSVGNIHQGFLRPGRIDTVIPVLPPDNQGMLKLVRQYGTGKDGKEIVKGSDEDIISAVEGLANSNAAFVQEAVERAKLGAIAHSTDDEMTITPTDIKTAVGSMKAHLQLVCPEAGSPNIDFDETVIDPMRMAMDMLMDQAAFALLNKIANPKTLEKIILKHAKPRRRPGDPFAPSAN